MAWSWSHSNDAYAAAYENLHALPLDVLQVIQAEWDTHCSQPPDTEFSQWRYARALSAIVKQNLPTDILADHIWERAELQATCDNGGFNAWMCPYGCGPHCVPFDREQVTA